MASKAKRAATSAMRPEPLVMTMKFTKTKMANTITPMMKLPLMIKPPNAAMTLPAASTPLSPFDKIRRVEDRFNASLYTVEISKINGKDVN